jgi:hypothetical protein
MNESDMKDCGLQLTAQDLYDVNNSSLKDAIVALNGGMCTGEMISSQGLMLTNHHCAFDVIQTHSTVDNDYLTDGFWAMTRDSELPNEGFSVSFLVSIESVTDRVLEDLGEVTESERNTKLREIFNEISSEKIDGTDYNARVKSFFGGNEFYLMTYITYNDVRLVGAPPSSIGKFGGDTDNWMWPRHTGDFTMFRVYADKENNPSSYNQDNKPLKPKHSLPVSIAGVQDGDYAMIMGYPGSTDRFLTSWGVKQAVDIEQPARVKIRGIKLDIMDQEMSKSQKVRIQYASKYARVSNYWKYFIGQSEQLVKNKVFDKKQKIENSFMTWYKNNELDKTYSESLSLIENALKNSSKYTIPKVYFQEAVVGSELILFMLRNFGPRTPLFKALSSGEGIEDEKDNFLKVAESFYKDYNATIDENTLAAVLSLYANDVPKEFQPELLISLNDKYKGDFKKFASSYYKKSPFKSYNLFKAWLNNDKLSVKMIEKDLVYQLKNEFLDVYRAKVMTPNSKFDSDYKKGMRLFVNGLQKMGMNKASDANSTMRFTYGNVLPYDPADAVHYDFYTTLEGVMQKEVITEDKNHEFYVPQKLKDLYYAKDFGPYARKEDGKLPVGFLSNNDITGGNSGSPVINAHGELIGTAFDGNWEAMSGDIYFEPNIQRTISVDIRYSLFIIDKYAGAKHLIDEMNIVTDRHEEEKSDLKPASVNPIPDK